ncbi:hypothetical protein B0A50_03502 [Salinomyces thailandicus]|uniref:Uncharacterized protein n=1 Tax=Salinomyces thailandicus TaxID=706561 RepID=A0A4V5N4W9_9PEZI|nr:hypothetical protein B0A50_03502 [Salinomyces thailandica]
MAPKRPGGRAAPSTTAEENVEELGQWLIPAKAPNSDDRRLVEAMAAGAEEVLS